FFYENGKTRLVDVSFTGNSYFSDMRLRQMFDKEAFELASINYFDDEYFTYFQDFMRTQYIQRGFVQVKVFDPVKVFNHDEQVASVEYIVQEGVRAYTRKITFEGLPPELESKIIDQLRNRIRKHFNPIDLVED